MKSRQKLTNFDKRKLTYEKQTSYINHSDKAADPLQLPPDFQKKISPPEYKKIKDAFFIEASQDYKLTRAKFPVVMRSIGIVLNTAEFHRIFDQLQDRFMTWREFLQAYVAKRGEKGSYNELSHSIYELGKEYRGDWNEFLKDLQILGDVLSAEEVQVLKKDILKGRTITTETLINGLLYQK